MLEYSNLNQEIRIVDVSGEIMILEDGSKWELFPFRNILPGFWHESQAVIITPGRRKRIITYHIKNLDENEILQGFFRGLVR